MTLDEVRLVITAGSRTSRSLLLSVSYGDSVWQCVAERSSLPRIFGGPRDSDGGRIAIDISEPGVDFRYSQMREFPEFAKKWNLTAAQAFASSLMVVFPPREVSDRGGPTSRKCGFHGVKRVRRGPGSILKTSWAFGIGKRRLL